MTGYLPFLDINVGHSYFQTQQCKYLKFVVTAASLRMMNNAGLIYHGRDNGISIFADKSKLEALNLYAQDSDEPFELQFKVFSSDPYFSFYTQPGHLSGQGILYFSHILSGQSQMDKTLLNDNGTIKLHRDDWVTEKDYSAIPELTAKGLIDSKDMLNPPYFIISIVISVQAVEDFSTGNSAPVFQVTFNSQENIWKYYLMSQVLSTKLSIVDIEEKIDFEPCGVEVLSSGKAAMTFRTLSPLPLQEKSPYHFQLQSTEESISKVLIKRLPVATASQRHQAVIDGNGVELSEIYINY